MQALQFAASSAVAEMPSLQPLKAYSMKRPHEAADAGTLQVSRRVSRKTRSAEVHAGGGGGAGV